MTGDRELAEKVYAATYPITEVERAHGALRSGVTIRKEFQCFDGCVHDSPDCRPGSGGFHGQGSRVLNFYVSVEGVGGVVASLHTPICAKPELTDEYMNIWTPLGAIDYHWVAPPSYMVDDSPLKCCWVTGGDCWMDGTMLQADMTVDVLLDNGATGVWTWLAEEWVPRLVNP